MAFDILKTKWWFYWCFLTSQKYSIVFHTSNSYWKSASTIPLMPPSSDLIEPQDSVLASLLFAIFIEDNPLHFSPSITLLTDKSQIYNQCFPSEILHGIEFIQRDAPAVSWLDHQKSQNKLQRSWPCYKSKVVILAVKRTSALNLGFMQYFQSQ